MKTVTSGLAVILLDSSPAGRRNRQEVPQEQNVDPSKPTFHQCIGEACFQSSPVFTIHTGKGMINNRLIIATGYIQGVNVS